MKRLWVVIGLMILIAVSCCVSYSFGRSSKVKMVDLNITVGVYDGQMRPLSGDGGVILVVKQLSFSDKPWPADHWSRVAGVPDAQGELHGKAKFPLDPEVTAEMARQARQ